MNEEIFGLCRISLILRHGQGSVHLPNAKQDIQVYRSVCVYLEIVFIHFKMSVLSIDLARHSNCV
jgi:hypothetical protein